MFASKSLLSSRSWPAHTHPPAPAARRINMSSTPPKKDGVEPPQSPDDDQHMDRNAEDTQAQGLGYEFEVKEQDRWLPIANGTYRLPQPPSF